MKKLLFPALAGAALLALAACGEKSAAPSAALAAEPPAAQTQPLRLMTDDEEFTGRTVGSADGYYYVDRGSGVAANLRYIDYATGQDVFLSSRPGGDHFSPEDESFLSSAAGSALAFPAGDALYLVRTGAPSAASGQDGLACVWVMGLDGSGRQVLYQGGSDEQLLSTIAADGEALYLVRCVTQGDPPAQQYTLAALSRDDGEMQTLCELPGYAKLIGAADGHLLLHTIRDESTQGTPQLQHQLLCFSLADSRLSQLASWTHAQDVYANADGSRLAIADVTAGTVTVWDFAAGQTLAAWPMEGHIPPGAGGPFFTGCRDGRFFYWNFAEECLEALSLADGAWSRVSLAYDDPDKLEKRPVEIIADAGDAYLVCMDKEVTARTYPGDGGAQPQRVEAVQPVYALIGKDDYWASEPRYRTVTYNT